VIRAIVTGGAGFIGSHLVKELLQHEAKVLVVDDLSTGKEENLKAIRAELGSEVAKNLEFTKIDIASAACAEEIKRFKPEFFFHLAAQMNVRLSVSEPVFDATSNVVGTVNLLHTAAQVGAKGFIFASTGGAIYGEQENFPAPESHRILPECPYGVSKRCGEIYLEYFARAHNLSTIALRFGNVYGPRQNPKGEAGVVAIFCEKILRGEALKINGTGRQTRDFVYVSDVVAANLKTLALIQRSTTPLHQIINIGTGLENNVLDIVEGLKAAWEEISREIQGSKVFSEITFGPALAGEQMRSFIEVKKAKELLGWSSQVNLQQGLSETLKSFS
jgi:UDP-glucose 4-epimerase